MTEKHINSIFKELFFNRSYPGIICDSRGEQCLLNYQAQLLFSLKNVNSIYDVFPDIHIQDTPPRFFVTDFRGHEHIIRCQYYFESEMWYIDIDKQSLTDWEYFVEDQKILHETYMELCSCKTEEEVYHKVVECGKNRLGLDRIGVLLFSIKENQMVGSWGTDERGSIVYQGDFHSSLDDEQWALDSITRKNYVAVHYNIVLKNKDKKVGNGWNALSCFFDGKTPVGWIACDNFLSGKPLSPWKKEIIGELGRITGQVVSHMRQEGRLQVMVDERTRELRESQVRLIEAEKMASLGSLVAGMSHLLNTPLGTALTAASMVTQDTLEVQEKLGRNQLKKMELISFLNKNLKGGNITVAALQKAGGLVNQFKQLSSEQTKERKRNFNLYELVEAAGDTIKNEYRECTLQLKNYTARNMVLHSFAGDFLQVFIHLFQNSVVHGFDKKLEGIIEVNSAIEGELLKLNICDNGTGIDTLHLTRAFEPFFTTKRESGGSGLGLSIVYNLVTKLKGQIEMSSPDKGLKCTLSFPWKELKNK